MNTIANLHLHCLLELTFISVPKMFGHKDLKLLKCMLKSLTNPNEVG